MRQRALSFRLDQLVMAVLATLPLNPDVWGLVWYVVDIHFIALIVFVVSRRCRSSARQ